MSFLVLFLADFKNESRLFGIRVRVGIFGKSLLLEQDFNENTKSAKNSVNLCQSVSKTLRAFACRVVAKRRLVLSWFIISDLSLRG